MGGSEGAGARGEREGASLAGSSGGEFSWVLHRYRKKKKVVSVGVVERPGTRDARPAFGATARSPGEPEGSAGAWLSVKPQWSGRR